MKNDSNNKIFFEFHHHIFVIKQTMFKFILLFLLSPMGLYAVPGDRCELDSTFRPPGATGLTGACQLRTVCADKGQVKLFLKKIKKPFLKNCNL